MLCTCETIQLIMKDYKLLDSYIEKEGVEYKDNFYDAL